MKVGDITFMYGCHAKTSKHENEVIGAIEIFFPVVQNLHN
jgi:hypothetical protein